jgi:hypothetical protein
MSLRERLLGADKPRAEQVRNGDPSRHEQEQPLSEEDRERVIEEARSSLPELDRRVEENLDRLRDLSKS